MLRYMILHHVGFPIRKSADIMLICSSPQLIAACHVLHRLLMPRHSPYALVRLNFLYISYTLVLFELSEFLWTFFVQDFIDSCSLWKSNLLAFCTLFWVALTRVPPFGEIVCTHFCAPFPFSFGKTNISLLDYLSSSVRFLLKKLFFYSIVKDLLESCDSWSVWMDSNHRPRAYQARALATWATNRN